MSRHYLMMCFQVLLVSCHGQAVDTKNFLEVLNKCVAGMNALESQLVASKQYQEKMFRRLENMLEKTETKLSTKIESVEQEMRDRGTTVENTVKEAFTKVVNGQQVVAEWTDTMEKNLLENIQMQMLQIKDVLKQRFGAFADHFGNDQSEVIVDRLRDDWANFSRTLFSEVPDLLNSTITASKKTIPCNRSENGLNAPSSCHELRTNDVMYDGKYMLNMPGQKAAFVPVYCDMTEDGGGWTVIMRRGDYGANRTSFDQNWNQYRKGFGNPEQEFWFGNEKIHTLSSSGKFELRVTLTAFDGDVVRITYDSFRVDNEESGYQLHVGNADPYEEGSSLNYHDIQPFSTRDRKYDHGYLLTIGSECPQKYKCGWWFGHCHHALPTGIYYRRQDKVKDNLGIRWLAWKDGDILKGVEMKIRPKDFDK